jgi:cytochrome c-type biogenesis protein CcmH
MTGFLVTAVLMALGAILSVTWPLLRPSGSGQAVNPVSALIAGLLIATTAVVLYPVLSRGAWRQAPAAAVEGGSIQELILATQRHPDDVSAWLELGRGYLRANQWALARRSYRRADTLSAGRSAPALAGLAQTIMFENNGVENDTAIELFDRALRIDPYSPQALFYTALALMHEGALEQSRQRFATLLSLHPPAAVSDAIQKQIVGLDAEIAANNAAAKASVGTAIHLNVVLSPALQGRVPAGAPLFVFVRAPNGGPPLAVKRLEASFPQQVELSAADAVIAGNTIAKGQRVQIVARISASGTPTAGTGDRYGQIAATAGDTAAHTLIIDR